MSEPITLSELERKVVLDYAGRRAAALQAASAAESSLSTLLQVIIERSGGNPSDRYALSEDCRRLTLAPAEGLSKGS